MAILTPPPPEWWQLPRRIRRKVDCLLALDGCVRTCPLDPLSLSQQVRHGVDRPTERLEPNLEARGGNSRPQQGTIPALQRRALRWREVAGVHDNEPLEPGLAHRPEGIEVGKGLVR